MYLTGEALVGDGNEVAHIDLLIGEKEGPIGQSFANSLAIQTERLPLYLQLLHLTLWQNQLL